MQKGVPQIMDITSIRSVLHYLTKNILPTKFETAQQPEPNTIQLCFRGVNSQTRLEVSWNGDSPRILKINKTEKIESSREQSNRQGRLEVIENKRTWLVLELEDEDGYLE